MIDPNQTVVFICDIQGSFKPVIHCMEHVIHSARMLKKGAEVFGMPVVVTEQYPSRLGATVEELEVKEGEAIAKTQFSMLTEEVEKRLAEMPERKHVLLCGVEAHVCVQQTVLGLIQKPGYSVTLVVDAVSSRYQVDRSVAIQTCRDHGAKLGTVESILFGMVGGKDHAHFKAISGLAKEARPEQQLTL
mmetsp:Transcript_32126/g.83303  ORF Transcript_32126/g.83303 Transcript_32126/m.83303 type:complete len:189 (-) Transcript_32126:145-711(-)